MDLFHLHLKGNHDNLYKENSEFLVNKDTFENRLYKRIYNMNPSVDKNKYSNITSYYDNALRQGNFPILPNQMNLGEIIGLSLSRTSDINTLKKLLEDAKKIIISEGINLREMAMEEYRIKNCSKIPSRLHSLFACSKDGVDFWASQITDNNVEVFRIEVFDDPFLSNERLLPDEGLSYGDKVKESYRYFNPRPKDLNSLTNEYLVQGKVKILEKVYEIRNK